MNHLRRAKVYLLGDRDYPEAVVTIPEHLLGDVPDLVVRARATNPALPLDAIVATIWRLGRYRVQELTRGWITMGKYGEPTQTETETEELIDAAEATLGLERDMQGPIRSNIP